MIPRIVPVLLILTLFACHPKEDRPDVSGVEVGPVHIERFDTAFFGLDSNHIAPGLFGLNQRYPYFTQDFVGNILGAGMLSDTSVVAFAAARQFLVSYLPIRDSLAQKYKDLHWLEKELQSQSNT